MFARVTLLEIDTVRTDVDDALELFVDEVLPRSARAARIRGRVVLQPRRARESSSASGSARRQPRPTPPARRGRPRAVRDPLQRAARPRAATRCVLADLPPRSRVTRRVNELFGLPVGTLASCCSSRSRRRSPPSWCLPRATSSSLRLALRNVLRRRGRTALIVVGLMLGTTIIAASLATGDTMSHTIRSTASRPSARPTRWCRPRAPSRRRRRARAATGVGYFARGASPARRAPPAPAPALVDGVAPAIIEPVAVQDPTSARTSRGSRCSRATPHAGRLRRPSARPRRRRVVARRPPPRRGVPQRATPPTSSALARATASSSTPAGAPSARTSAPSCATTAPARRSPALLMPLDAAQHLLAHLAASTHVLISNRGDETSGAVHTDAVSRALRPDRGAARASRPTDEARRARHGRRGRQRVHVALHDVRLVLDRGGHPADLPHLRDARRRATQRAGHRPRGRHAARPSRRSVRLRRRGVRRRRRRRRRRARRRGRVRDGGGDREAFGAEGIDIEYAVTGRSLVVAYALGVLLTLAVVAVSAWRVSRMTSSPRSATCPSRRAPARRAALAAGGRRARARGAAGASPARPAAQATPLMLGVSLARHRPRAAAAPGRASPSGVAYTGAGLAIVVLLDAALERHARPSSAAARWTSRPGSWPA